MSCSTRRCLGKATTPGQGGATRAVQGWKDSHRLEIRANLAQKGWLGLNLRPEIQVEGQNTNVTLMKGHDHVSNDRTGIQNDMAGLPPCGRAGSFNQEEHRSSYSEGCTSRLSGRRTTKRIMIERLLWVGVMLDNCPITYILIREPFASGFDSHVVLSEGCIHPNV